MELSGWGNTLKAHSKVACPSGSGDVLRSIVDVSSDSVIARGLGRSYGDSALASHVISTRYMDQFLAFDETSGLLSCAAGVSLAELLAVFVPKGWFLPVTPGTRFVTVGGVIASDGHGKNHHLNGSFCDYVTSLKIATVSEGIVECSSHENAKLFRATCGGMGLTGVIVEATFRLLAINSAYINETRLKADSLDALFNLLEVHRSAHYSVAWVDCQARGRAFGRSILYLGEHADGGGYAGSDTKGFAVPVNMPSDLLNRHSIRAFNAIRFARMRHQMTKHVAHVETFFYPLDRISHWNRLYGASGFVQYQFVLPKAAGLEGVTTILRRIAKSDHSPFLSVLKAMGKANKNMLSFPMEGYTLALDFKMAGGLFDLLDELDEIVLDHGGRHYLAKDVRLPEQVFKKAYPAWEAFACVRSLYGADRVFNSLQSNRLGL